MIIERKHRRGSIFVFITALARIVGFITIIGRRIDTREENSKINSNLGLVFVTFLEWLPQNPSKSRFYIT